MNVTSAGGVADLAPLDGLRRDMARTFAYGRSAFVVNHVRRAVDELNRDLEASAQWAATRSGGDGTDLIDDVLGRYLARPDRSHVRCDR